MLRFDREIATIILACRQCIRACLTSSSLVPILKGRLFAGAAFLLFWMGYF